MLCPGPKTKPHPAGVGQGLAQAGRSLGRGEAPGHGGGAEGLVPGMALKRRLCRGLEQRLYQARGGIGEVCQSRGGVREAKMLLAARKAGDQECPALVGRHAGAEGAVRARHALDESLLIGSKDVALFIDRAIVFLFKVSGVQKWRSELTSART